MANILANSTRLASTPGMLAVYYEWFIEKYFYSGQPWLKGINDTQIGGLASFSEYWTFYKGIPESEAKLMENCLKASAGKSLAIDVGANIGFFTVALSSLGYSQVHSFEPIPQTFEVLKSNIINNGLSEGVFLNRLAIGDLKGTIDFEVFDKSPAINRMIPSNGKEYRSRKVQRVPTLTLDEYCARHNINKIDFLKIDVEGMEPLVIEGAKDIFKKRQASKILLEICPANLNNAGFSLTEIYAMMLDIGYHPHRLTNRGEVGKYLSLSEINNIVLENIVLIPQ